MGPLQTRIIAKGYSKDLSFNHRGFFVAAANPSESCPSPRPNKYLFVGDLHCDAKALEQAAETAIIHKAKLCLLGDYTSYGDALDIVLALTDILPETCSVFGNHEYYLARHAFLGGRKFSCMDKTWGSLHATSQARHALLRYLDIIQDLPAWRCARDMVWAHGGIDDIMMEEEAPPLGRILRTGHRDHLFNLAMHSRTNNIKLPNAAPTPDWAHNITAAHALVGHYIRHRDRVSLVRNQHGCVTYFLDCGGGKGGRPGLVLMQPDLSGRYQARIAHAGQADVRWNIPEVEDLYKKSSFQKPRHQLSQRH